MFIKNIIKKIFLSPVIGKKKFQKLFEALNQFSLIGMNIGLGSTPKETGEKWVLEYINLQLKSVRELTIFDVGANIGHYSLLLAEVFGEKATIHSFEPSHKTFMKLSKNIAGKEKIILHNLGFGNEDKNTTLYTNSDESGLASVYRRRLEHFNIDMNQSEEIELETVDAFCKKNKIKRVHLLKLDVEGHEKKILEGTSIMLNSGDIDFIQFEFGGCNIDSRTYFQDFFYLLKDNYRIFRILQDGLYPVDQYKEKYETFITTNYLAEKKEKK